MVELVNGKEILSSKIREVSEILSLKNELNITTTVVTDYSTLKKDDIKKANVIVAHDLHNQKVHSLITFIN